MSNLKLIQTGAVFLSCLGLLFPGNRLYAKQKNVLQKSNAAPAVYDVALATGGRLQGAIVNVQGKPLSGERVVLRQSRRIVAETVTDKRGRFIVNNLRGGAYRIDAANQTRVYRLWSKGTSPPVARPQLLVVDNQQILRGQRPLGEIFISKPFLLAMIVAAAIAIPIAVQNSESDLPPSS